jgi:hypothetical protein
MNYEELKYEKLYEAKQEMYRDMQHERNMSEDSEYALNYIIESNSDDIDKAKELLDKVVEKFLEAGLDVKDWQILKDYY